MSKPLSPTAATVLTIMLLFLFTLPSWTGTLGLILGQMDGRDALGRRFMLMLTQPSPIWDMTRTGLAFLVAAVAGAGFGRWVELRSGVLAIAVLLMFAPLGVLGLAFMDPNISGNLWQNLNQDGLTQTIDSSAGFQTIWNSHLSGQAQTLAAHLALFLGLKTEKKP